MGWRPTALPGPPRIGRRAAVKNAGPSNLSGHAALFLSLAVRRFDSHPYRGIAPSTSRNVPDILASGHAPASRTCNATQASVVQPPHACAAGGQPRPPRKAPVQHRLLVAHYSRKPEHGSRPKIQRDRRSMERRPDHGQQKRRIRLVGDNHKPHRHGGRAGGPAAHEQNNGVHRAG